MKIMFGAFMFDGKPSENDIKREFLDALFSEMRTLAEKRTVEYGSVSCTLEEMCTALIENLMKLTER